MAESINLNDIKAQADAFFASLLGMVQIKDSRIVELERQLREAKETLSGLVEVRSDFALLKAKTLAKAELTIINIQATLENK